MRGLMHKIDVNLFIDIIALYMNPQATFVTIYGLIVTGNRLFTYSTWKFYCHLMQVFDERQKLIKTMKGKSIRLRLR